MYKVVLIYYFDIYYLEINKLIYFWKRIKVDYYVELICNFIVFLYNDMWYWFVYVWFGCILNFVIFYLNFCVLWFIYLFDIKW